MDLVYKILRKFGLTENETRVYLEALKHEELSPFKISKLTKIPRTTVYDVLMGLSLKGLVKLEQSDGFQKQQTRIRAKNPSKLRTILQKKRVELALLEHDILNILPGLKKVFHKGKVNANFKFFPGIEGARKVHLSEGEDKMDLATFIWNFLWSSDIFGGDTYDKYISKLAKLRKIARHKTKIIVPLNDWTKHCLGYQIDREVNYLRGVEMRYVDNPLFNLYQKIVIKGNWLRISCVKKDEVWGLVINSPLLTKSLKSIFQINWEVAKPVTLKLVKSWGLSEFSEIKKKERERKNGKSTKKSKPEKIF